jgi:hypothetical protein
LFFSGTEKRGVEDGLRIRIAQTNRRTCPWSHYRLLLGTAGY